MHNGKQASIPNVLRAPRLTEVNQKKNLESISQGLEGAFSSFSVLATPLRITTSQEMLGTLQTWQKPRALLKWKCL